MFEYLKDNFIGMKYIENNDGTYFGSKETEVYDKESDKTYKASIEYPRLRIVWKEGLELIEPLTVDVLPKDSIGTEGSDTTLWNLVIPE